MRLAGVRIVEGDAFAALQGEGQRALAAVLRSIRQRQGAGLLPCARLLRVAVGFVQLVLRILQFQRELEFQICAVADALVLQAVYDRVVQQLRDGQSAVSVTDIQHRHLRRLARDHLRRGIDGRGRVRDRIRAVAIAAIRVRSILHHHVGRAHGDTAELDAFAILQREGDLTLLAALARLCHGDVRGGAELLRRGAQHNAVLGRGQQHRHLKGLIGLRVRALHRLGDAQLAHLALVDEFQRHSGSVRRRRGDAAAPHGILRLVALVHGIGVGVFQHLVERAHRNVLQRYAFALLQRQRTRTVCALRVRAGLRQRKARHAALDGVVVRQRQTVLLVQLHGEFKGVVRVQRIVQRVADHRLGDLQVAQLAAVDKGHAVLIVHAVDVARYLVGDVAVRRRDVTLAVVIVLDNGVLRAHRQLLQRQRFAVLQLHHRLTVRIEGQRIGIGAARQRTAFLLEGDGELEASRCFAAVARHFLAERQRAHRVVHKFEDLLIVVRFHRRIFALGGHADDQRAVMLRAVRYAHVNDVAARVIDHALHAGIVFCQRVGVRLADVGFRVLHAHEEGAIFRRGRRLNNLIALLQREPEAALIAAAHKGL